MTNIPERKLPTALNAIGCYLIRAGQKSFDFAGGSDMSEISRIVREKNHFLYRGYLALLHEEGGSLFDGDELMHPHELFLYTEAYLLSSDFVDFVRDLNDLALNDIDDVVIDDATPIEHRHPVIAALWEQANIVSRRDEYDGRYVVVLKRDEDLDLQSPSVRLYRSVDEIPSDLLVIGHPAEVRVLDPAYLELARKLMEFIRQERSALPNAMAELPA